MEREHAILTFSNVRFYPLEPKAEEVKIEDIAHALSQMCRANGHFKRFYSVGQHCINCAKEAKARGLTPRIQLACLIHDASEAYISDITRPVKYYLEEYKEIEGRLQQVIFSAFHIGDLSEAELEFVEELDNALLYYEFEQFHHHGISDTFKADFAIVPDVGEKEMKLVEDKFKQLAKELLFKRGIS
jgi:5'-deoxynucleotidase YfbR-like HD superfamily hydrolase